jgi:hypothetical protein
MQTACTLAGSTVVAVKPDPDLAQPAFTAHERRRERRHERRSNALDWTNGISCGRAGRGGPDEPPRPVLN